MELKSDFDEFLRAIRPTPKQSAELKAGHQTLRARLRQDPDLAGVRVTDLLQGSYRRHTAIRPKAGKRSDVDIIVVTNLDEAQVTPSRALARFEPFLEKHYSGKWRRQGRSLGIEMSHIDLDLVITSAPPEVAAAVLRELGEVDVDGSDWLFDTAWGREPLEAFAATSWRDGPLRIPDRDAGEWQDTHPLAQIEWTRDKNRRTNGNFVNVVKALKWWRLESEGEARHPKGFLLERIVADCCPDGIRSVPEGIAYTLENIAIRYRRRRQVGRVPVLNDYGLPHMNVLARLSFEDFAAFYDAAEDAAPLARAALECLDVEESRSRWCRLLGSRFPSPSIRRKSAPKFDVEHRHEPTWECSSLHPVTLTGEWRARPGAAWRPFSSNALLPNGVELRFRATRDIESGAQALWQVVNTGQIASRKGQLRGGFYESSRSGDRYWEHTERTEYAGAHWVECFVTDPGQCLVGRSGPMVVRVSP